MAAVAGLHSPVAARPGAMLHLLLLLLLTRRLAWLLVPKLQGHVKNKKDDMFGRQRKKQGQQRHQYTAKKKGFKKGFQRVFWG